MLSQLEPLEEHAASHQNGTDDGGKDEEARGHCEAK